MGKQNRTRRLRLHVSAVPLLLFLLAGSVFPALSGPIAAAPRAEQAFLEDGTVRMDFYDPADRLSQQLFFTADGQIQTDAYSYEYDPAGRLSRRLTYDTRYHEFYSSDRYTYDKAGRVSKTESIGVLEPFAFAEGTFFYDAKGRLVTQEDWQIISSSYEYAYTYDTVGRLSKVVTYDRYSKQSKPRKPLSWRTLAYDAKGALQTETFYRDNGTVEKVRTYGPGGKLAYLTQTETDGLRVVTYNELGQRAREDRLAADQTPLGHTLYRYHPSGCLAEETRYGADGAVEETRTYTDNFDVSWADTAVQDTLQITRTELDEAGRVTALYAQGEQGEFLCERRVYRESNGSQLSGRYRPDGTLQTITCQSTDGRKQVGEFLPDGKLCKATTYAVDGTVQVRDYRLPWEPTMLNRQEAGIWSYYSAELDGSLTP